MRRMGFKHRKNGDIFLYGEKHKYHCEWREIWMCLCMAVCLCITAALSVGCEGVKKKAEENIQTEGELTMDSVVMRVGDYPITYREVLIYMYQLKERYEPGFGKDIWNFQPDGDRSFGEYAMEEVKSNLTQIKIIVQQAQKEGVTLDEDEKAEVSEQAEDYLKNIRDEDIKKYGLTKEFIEQVYSDNRLAEKMFDVTTSVVATDIPDEDAKQITIQYFMVLTDGVDRNGKSVHLKKKKQLSEAKERAKKLREQAKQADDFGNFADANSELEDCGLTYGAENVSREFAQESGVPMAVLHAGLSMKTGQIGAVLQAKNGYYVLYCVSDFDEDATRAKKESMIEQEQEEVFSNAYTEWSGGYRIEFGQKMWEQISFMEM